MEHRLRNVELLMHQLQAKHRAARAGDDQPRATEIEELILRLEEYATLLLAQSPDLGTTLVSVAAKRETMDRPHIRDQRRSRFPQPLTRPLAGRAGQPDDGKPRAAHLRANRGVAAVAVEAGTDGCGTLRGKKVKSLDMDELLWTIEKLTGESGG